MVRELRSESGDPGNRWTSAVGLNMLPATSGIVFDNMFVTAASMTIVTGTTMITTLTIIIRIFTGIIIIVTTVRSAAVVVGANDDGSVGGRGWGASRGQGNA